MAVTAMAAQEVKIVGTGLSAGGGSDLTMTVGRSLLSSGTVELVTGLSTVEIFIATGIQTTATEALVLVCQEDLPSATGTLTIDGSLIDEGAASKDGDVEDFSWIAWGYK